ncbi:T9SS type A sorting domain-containing protein [Pontibacter sp. 172403-2]|uniref:M43 family zinc metalloprotease n=1 Tax=Pontibacter rufus TaxID=2791028 RepID=UPI0018AFD7B8|nr:M43 family zinc metalloprotease [Pontibacter sp. 172403-2]MBF9253034.1 T9SS type A sorting domain-containing protein [Pontibacter sp. 172403-2]
MRLFILTVTFCLVWSVAAFAQNIPPLPNRGRNCGVEPYLTALQQQRPEFTRMQQQAAQAIQEVLRAKPQGQQQRQATLTIPVVFHVVYNTAQQNIPDAQLYSQLAVLNADFRRLNADTANTPDYFTPYAADTEIEFCLAKVDPEGNETSGITRTKTSHTSFNLNDNVKHTAQGGADIWDRDRYLNIWVCAISDDVLGYASTPGSPADADGVVLHFAVIGAAPDNTASWAYNGGRTATHEIGHWLGLRHIWGNGSSCIDSDGINDTPNQLEENNGCPGETHASCGNEPYGDMFQNYMDYTDDACMNLFTKGQAAYMRGVLSSVRSSIPNSIACSRTLRSDFKATSLSDTLTIASKAVSFSDASQGIKATSRLWQFEGGIPSTSTELNPTVTYPVPGKYKVSLTITNGTLSSTETKAGYIHVTVDDLVVYPSPASDFIIVEQPARVTVRQVEIRNQLGQRILTAEVRDRVLRINIRQLPAGIYFLHITSTNGSVIKKISVVK